MMPGPMPELREGSLFMAEISRRSLSDLGFGAPSRWP